MRKIGLLGKAGNYVFNIVIIIVLFSAGFFTGLHYDKQPLASDSGSSKNGILENDDFALIFEVWKSIKNNYIEDSKIDLEKMVYGSVKGFVSALGDPYTAYLDPEEAKSFRENLDSELQGIGAEVGMDKGNLIIVSPLRESPAEKAGLLPRDMILEIDGTPTSDMNLIDAVMKIRGEKGTSVVLTIFRDKTPEPFKVTIIRDEIKVESVTHEMKGDIFYISLNQFSDDTRVEFSNAINEMVLKKPKGMIIDLRFNGGGYLDMAVEVLSELIKDKKETVRMKRRDVKDNQIMYTSGNARAFDIPLVVLINEGSASASEIVAGAIQDYKRGLVLGTQSFGKGSVQELETLSDGSSLRLTIAKWLTPNGRSIDEVGVTPDKIVEMTLEDIEKDKDPQLDAAITYLKSLK